MSIRAYRIAFALALVAGAFGVMWLAQQPLSPQVHIVKAPK